MFSARGSSCVKLVTMVTYTLALQEISVMVCAKEVIAQKAKLWMEMTIPQSNWVFTKGTWPTVAWWDTTL